MNELKNSVVILMNLTREMNSPMRIRKMAQRKVIASYKTPPKVGPETLLNGSDNISSLRSPG